MFWLNSLVALLLVISFLIPYLPPKSFPTLAIFSVLVSPLIVLNIIFAIYWLIRLRRQFLVSTLVLVIAYFHFNPFFEFSSEGNESEYNSSLKILSYNVHLMNAYEENPTHDVQKIFSALLGDKQPEVVFIQEYYRDSKLKFPDYPYQFIHFKEFRNKNGDLKISVLGHAILSKYPLLNTGAFDFPKTYNNTLYADVVKGKDTVRIYNLHLKSLGILPSVSSLQDGNKEKLLQRMSHAFVGQQEHLEEILKHKNTSPHPVILGGDFNNTPFSYAYRMIDKEMKDAFVERGNGLGTTYLFDSYPMRIDYIFVSEGLDVLQFETTTNTFSDHYPVSTTVGWSRISEGKEN